MQTQIPNSIPTREIEKRDRIQRDRMVRNDLFNRADFFIEDDNKDFLGGSQKRSGLKLALWTWMSAFIDLLILTSMSCFALIMFSLLMKSPARDVVSFVFISPSLIEVFCFAFVLCMWAYLVLTRAFMGASIGEWTCQLRIGQPAQRIRSSYVLQVVARTSLILMSGIIVLPLLSLILKRDLAGDLTGIKIYSLV